MLKEYELTEGQYARLLEAQGDLVPVMTGWLDTSIEAQKQRDRVLAVWAEVAKEVGVVCDTIVPGSLGERWIIANPLIEEVPQQ